MKVTVIVAAVRRALNNPAVREFARTVRRHLEEDVLQEAIEAVVRILRGTTRPKAHAEREER